MPFRAVVHGFYAVGTHFALLVGGFYAVGTRTRDSGGNLNGVGTHTRDSGSTLNADETSTRDSGGNLNGVGTGHAGYAEEVEAHDIKIGRQGAGALLADNVESASETTQNLSETIRL